MANPGNGLRSSLGFIAVLIGLIITIALVSQALMTMFGREKEAFMMEANHVHDEISRRVETANEILHALATLFNTSTQVDVDQFRVFSEEFLHRHDAVVSVLYLPLIEQQVRDQFESEIQDEGYVTFAIKEKLNNKILNAPVRERYFPILYQEPFTPLTAGQMGLDALSVAQYRPAIIQAIDTAQIIASMPENSDQQRASYVLFKALYSGQDVIPANRAERRKTVNGLLAIRIDAGKLISSVQGVDHLELSLDFDPGFERSPPIRLISYQAGHHDRPDGWVIKRLQVSHTIGIHGQQFVTNMRSPVHWHDTEYMLFFLAALIGLTISSLLVVAARGVSSRARLLQRRNVEIQEIVWQRTKELAREKTSLENEIVEREKAEAESLKLSQILDESSNEIYVFDANSLLFDQVNQGARSNLGYSMDELKRMTAVDIKPEISVSEFLELLKPLRDGEKEVLIFETLHQRKNGSTYPVEVRLQLFKLGETRKYVAIILDISERLAKDNALRESEQRFRILSEHAPEAIVVLDMNTSRFVEFNKQAEQLFGMNAEQLFNVEPFEVSKSVQVSGVPAKELIGGYIQQAIDGESPVFEWLIVNNNGEEIPCEVRLVRLPAAGRVLVRGSITDISERKCAQAQMAKLSRALERAGDSVIITDPGGIIEYVNPAFETITGFSSEDAIGQQVNILKSGRHNSEFYKNLWATILSGNDYRDVLTNRKKDGSLYYEEKAITPLMDEQGKITGFVSTGKDITERIQFQEKLSYLAHHDVLTDLPNRAMFIDRLEHALSTAKRHERILAVLFMDLDRFKIINDTLGHSTGDLLLQQLAQRLLSCLRETDTIARLGGDEFTIILEDLKDTDVISLVASKILDMLVKPFVLEGQEFFVTASLGISVYPNDCEDAGTLLKNADTAMYRAKELGRNNFQFYSEEMGVKSYQRLNLETDLRHALSRNEFTLHYQPQVDYVSGSIIGAEALIRWHHPERGLVSPFEFIPVLEETGLITSVGEWVLRTACAQTKYWQDLDLPRIRISVNLSGRQIVDKDFNNLVTDILSEAGLDPYDLELEITETIMMQNARTIIDKLNSISQGGVRFAIDDFGTGYSSLGYLKRFPINTLKIDRTFVRDITTDPDDVAIITTIIAMAQALKMDVIAEGVETEEQALLLQQKNCRYMQGYMFSKPLPAEEFTELLQHQHQHQHQQQAQVKEIRQG